MGLFHPDRVEPELKLELFSCNSQNASCRSIQWPGNQVPIARREFRIKLISVEKSLYIFILSKTNDKYGENSSTLHAFNQFKVLYKIYIHFFSCCDPRNSFGCFFSSLQSVLQKTQV